MKTNVIEERLKKYRIDSEEAEFTAIREITQELILFSLATTDFFSYAAFQGGTCLRIIHGLNRFSEDLDFILKKKDSQFSWQQYLSLIGVSLEHYGYSVELLDKSRSSDIVKKAFIKEDSIGKILRLSYLNRQGSQRKIRIKLEIDTNPPDGGEFESSFLGFPAPSTITTETLPTLFAGKSHALLCRKYEKGRDWYDFLWYMTNKVPLNYARLSSSLNQLGPWMGQNLIVDRQWYVEQMQKRIMDIDWTRARKDVASFISSAEQNFLRNWDADLFQKALERLP